jgi:uncharacterized membrane protein YjjB (DUF3815 family)
MLVPTVLFLLFNFGTVTQAGIIPMATDIVIAIFFAALIAGTIGFLWLRITLKVLKIISILS